MFLEQELWMQMCTFHPTEWRGSNRQLKEIVGTLSTLDVDQVAATQPVSLVLAYQWLELMIILRATLVNKQRTQDAGKGQTVRLLPMARPLPAAVRPELGLPAPGAHESREQWAPLRPPGKRVVKAKRTWGRKVKGDSDSDSD
jgi:hypothetical protein